MTIRKLEKQRGPGRKATVINDWVLTNEAVIRELNKALEAADLDGAETLKESKLTITEQSGQALDLSGTTVARTLVISRKLLRLVLEHVAGQEVSQRVKSLEEMIASTREGGRYLIVWASI